jgi:hypothetical protein
MSPAEISSFQLARPQDKSLWLSVPLKIKALGDHRGFPAYSAAEPGLRLEFIQPL